MSSDHKKPLAAFLVLAVACALFMGYTSWRADAVRVAQDRPASATDTPQLPDLGAALQPEQEATRAPGPGVREVAASETTPGRSSTEAGAARRHTGTSTNAKSARTRKHAGTRKVATSKGASQQRGQRAGKGARNRGGDRGGVPAWPDVPRGTEPVERVVDAVLDNVESRTQRGNAIINKTLTAIMEQTSRPEDLTGGRTGNRTGDDERHAHTQDDEDRESAQRGGDHESWPPGRGH